MNKEEYKKRMENPKYKELIVTKAEKNIDKDYVFISYRSNNWERDLTEITYKLQKDYGLRVYFDKEFAKEDNIWVEQFEENMRSPRCKAVICFFDKGYCSSYATLLEYMFALNQGKKIIPVNFDFNENDKDGWKELLDNSSSTGLGEDNGNPGWEEEKSEFDEQFEGLLLLDKEKYKANLKGKYKKTFKILSVSDCAKIFKVIQPKNQGVYVDSEDFYRQFIIEKLLNDEETKNVFDEQLKKPITNTKPESGSGSDTSTGPDTTTGSDTTTGPDTTTGSDTTTGFDESINENMTLESFSKLCEDISFCAKLREVRNTCKKQIFDFFIASILRGCDNKVEEKGPRKGAYNYCVYVISEKTDFETPKLGASQYTWESNSRKAMRKEDMPESYFNEQGKIKSGTLGEYSEIFEKLSPELTIGSLLEKYRSEEKGFRTKDNGSIIDSWEKIKTINIGDSKFGIPF